VARDAAAQVAAPIRHAGHELLAGAIDTHVHTSPDVVPRSLDDHGAIEAAERAGMRALVLKSHHTATGDRAQVAERYAATTLRVFGGVALDTAVGGLNPAAVEASARLGGAIVWLPTTTAATFLRWIESNVVDHPFGPSRTGVEVLAEDGRPLPALIEVLDAVAEHRLILATGHLAGEEIRAVVRAARARGIERIVVTHPEHPYVALPVAEQRELAADGVLFERCYLAFPEQRGDAVPIARHMLEVGCESTVLATDFGQARNPVPVEGFASLLGELLDLGVPRADVVRASSQNAAQLLGLPDDPPARAGERLSPA
jgi:hypothetical protein